MSAPAPVKKFDVKASKGSWTPERDKRLIELVKSYGGRLSWNQLSYAFPGFRGKHLRQRYRNHLDPNLKQTPWTWEEDQILKKCYIRFGNCWEHIARHLVGRSANQVKNRIRKKEFRDLFQAPTESAATVPKSYLPQNFKQPTIFQQQKRIELKTEHNNKLLRDEIKKQLNNEPLQSIPMPPSLVRLIEKQKKKYTNKTKRFTVTLLHLHRTYRLIRQKINNKDSSEFYSVFEKKTKKEIFTKIQSLQWTICQFWPFVTSRNNTESADQEIAFFLFCLAKANNPLANKLLHRLMKCQDEDYLIRKFETIIDDIDKFIQQELNSMRDKQILAQNNQEQILKIDIENDSQELDLPSRGNSRVKFQNSEEGSGKKRGRRRKGMPAEEGPDIKVLEGQSSKKKAQDILKLQEDELLDQSQSKKSSESGLNNYELMMYGKEIDIGNQLDPSKLRQAIKKEQQEEDQVKIQAKMPKNKKPKKAPERKSMMQDGPSPTDSANNSDAGLGNEVEEDIDIWSSFEEDLMDKSGSVDSNISDLDFDIPIELEPTLSLNPQTFCFEQQQSKQHDQPEQSKGSNTQKENSNFDHTESNGHKSKQNSQADHNSSDIMKSVYMKEILKKTLKEIDPSEVLYSTSNNQEANDKIVGEDEIKLEQQGERVQKAVYSHE